MFNKLTVAYSAMLYELADQIEQEDRCITTSAESVREAAERMDAQTVTIGVTERANERMRANLEHLRATHNRLDVRHKALLAAAEAVIEYAGEPEGSEFKDSLALLKRAADDHARNADEVSKFFAEISSASGSGS